MPISSKSAERVTQEVLAGQGAAEAVARIRRRPPTEVPLLGGFTPRLVPAGRDTDEQLVARREHLARLGFDLSHLTGGGPPMPVNALDGKIENFIGFAPIPVGIAGPLRVNGASTQGDFFIPLATTEGTLVASINRGAHMVSRAGGVSVASLTESVSRAPCFTFATMAEASTFLLWLLPLTGKFPELVATTSRHCRFIDMRPALAGRDLYLSFEYTTGDASGQNMVTIATEAICRWILEQTPVKPVRWYLEGNMSGDKKATMLAFTYARGKKVVAEAVVPDVLTRKYLRASASDLVEYWKISILGGVQSGSIGVHGHFANALAAMFIACGQDVACVSEASVGITRVDVTADGSLYVAITLPNMIVGTVGGGTVMPVARECLRMLGCEGEGGSRKLAEIFAAVALAGEISLIGALVSGEFGRAHASYGRPSAGAEKGAPSLGKP